MKFRIASDLHCEFQKYYLPKLPDDKDTCLLLAGDIMSAKYPNWDWLDVVSNQFKHIVYVFGNHEYYGMYDLSEAISVRQDIHSRFPNIHVLENDCVVFDNVAIVGSTMWTDFDRCNHLLLMDVIEGISDYDYIENITPDIILNTHYCSRDYMFEQVIAQKEVGRKVICVMHHAPTWYSLATGSYVSNKLNGAYASDLSPLILDTNPDVIVHGHIHESCDYMCGDTRIIANPRGYPHDSLLINGDYVCDFTFTLE